jgi:hypothetical protein
LPASDISAVLVFEFNRGGEVVGAGFLLVGSSPSVLQLYRRNGAQLDVSMSGDDSS